VNGYSIKDLEYDVDVLGT